MIPTEPAVLLSFINMKLRDFCEGLDELCEDLDIDREELLKKMEAAGYHYNEETKQFK